MTVPVDVRRLVMALGVALALSCGTASCTGGDEPASSGLVLFAAASLGPPLAELCALHERETGLPVRLSLGPSGTLARQIERGAPCDLFLSAHPRWVDHLEQRGLAVPSSRTALLTNRLVVVVPAATDAEPKPPAATAVEPGPLPPVLRAARVAIAEPTTAPVGRYARQALETLGWWQELEPRLVVLADARAVVATVARRACDAGIAYASDASTTPGVRIAAEVPPTLHDPIRYPAVLIAGSREPEAARALLARLTTPAARAVFIRHGLRPLEEDDARRDPPPAGRPR